MVRSQWSKSLLHRGERTAHRWGTQVKIDVRWEIAPTALDSSLQSNAHEELFEAD
jgi:hypothetical protein